MVFRREDYTRRERRQRPSIQAAWERIESLAVIRELIREAVKHPLVTVAAGLSAGLIFSFVTLNAFAELADEVFEGETRRIDRSALLWVNSTFPDWMEGTMRFITALGYYWFVMPILLIACAVFYYRGLKFSAALLAIGAAGSALLTTALKIIFQRTRPEVFETGYDASSFAFPSGHATIAVGFYGTLVMLAAWRLAGWKQWTVVAAGAVLITLIGFSRLYLGVHYPTDVLAGYLAAALWVSAVGTVLLFWRSLRVYRKK